MRMKNQTESRQRKKKKKKEKTTHGRQQMRCQVRVSVVFDSLFFYVFNIKATRKRLQYNHPSRVVFLS